MENHRKFFIQAGEIGLAAVAHLPEKLPAPVIVCCHGLLSLKDSPKYIEIGARMTRAGFCVLRFDFSGCGESPPRRGAPLVGARQKDLDAVLDFAGDAPWSDGRIGLLGSSFGGFLTLLAANAYPERIQAAVCWAALYDATQIHPEAMDMEGLKDLFPEGFRLGEPQNLASLAAARRVLLIHGQEDRIVDWRQALTIYDLLQDPKNLILMRTADHQFLDPSWRDAAVRASLDWFLRFF